jgi:hypothetical protein
LGITFAHDTNPTRRTCRGRSHGAVACVIGRLLVEHAGIVGEKSVEHDYSSGADDHEPTDDQSTDHEPTDDQSTDHGCADTLYPEPCHGAECPSVRLWNST